MYAMTECNVKHLQAKPSKQKKRQGLSCEAINKFDSWKKSEVKFNKSYHAFLTIDWLIMGLIWGIHHINYVMGFLKNGLETNSRCKYYIDCLINSYLAL